MGDFCFAENPKPPFPKEVADVSLRSDYPCAAGQGQSTGSFADSSFGKGA